MRWPVIASPHKGRNSGGRKQQFFVLFSSLVRYRYDLPMTTSLSTVFVWTDTVRSIPSLYHTLGTVCCMCVYHTLRIVVWWYYHNKGRSVFHNRWKTCEMVPWYTPHHSTVLFKQPSQNAIGQTPFILLHRCVSCLSGVLESYIQGRPCQLCGHVMWNLCTSVGYAELPANRIILAYASQLFNQFGAVHIQFILHYSG